MKRKSLTCQPDEKFEEFLANARREFNIDGIWNSEGPKVRKGHVWW